MEEVEIQDQKNELIQRFRNLLENQGLRLDQKILLSEEILGIVFNETSGER